MDTINSDKPNDAKDALAKEGVEPAVEDTATDSTEGHASEAADTRTDAAEDADFDTVDNDDDEEAAEAELAALNAERSASAGVLPGAAALVGLGLALASVTGTWLGTIMQQREQLIGQIASSSAPAAKQMAAEFATPWHTAAVFNGVFGLVAVLVAVAVLIGQSVSLAPPAASWVKAVTWAALILGVIGLVIAGVMYFDVFTHMPTLPATSAPSGSAG